MKSSEKPSRFSATTFRTVLISSVVILAIGVGIGFGFGIQLLKKYAVDVSHKKVDATASSGNIQNLQKMNEQLSSYKDALEKADSLKITSAFPLFRIIDEVKTVAHESGVTISSYNYGSGSTEGASSGSSATTSPTSSEGTTTATPTQSTNNGTISLTVNLESPISYRKLLQFVYAVEHHIPKMEVDGVNISPHSTGSVSVEALSIQMYVNQ